MTLKIALVQLSATWIGTETNCTPVVAQSSAREPFVFTRLSRKQRVFRRIALHLLPQSTVRIDAPDHSHPGNQVPRLLMDPFDPHPKFSASSVQTDTEVGMAHKDTFWMACDST